MKTGNASKRSRGWLAFC